MAKIISDIGIEIESETLIAGEFRNFPPQLRSWKVQKDASMETPETYEPNSGLLIRDENHLISIGKKVRGCELVSPILDTEEDQFFSDLKLLTSYLQSIGENAESTRAGIHFHVCMNYNLSILKAILILGAHLEQVFFQVGTMGYRHRGEINDSIYARPITKFGPVVVPLRRGWGQVFEIEKLLRVKTENNFWMAYGDSTRNHGNRYVPIRYHWLNLFSLLGLGTLEFRVFNKSLNPYYIYSTLILCQKFCEYALISGLNPVNLDQFQENSIFDFNDKQQAIDTLNNFAELVHIPEDTLEILVEMMEKGDKVTLQPGYVHSHLFEHPRMKINAHWVDANYSPTAIDIKEVRKPAYIDYHVLQDEIDEYMRKNRNVAEVYKMKYKADINAIADEINHGEYDGDLDIYGRIIFQIDDYDEEDMLENVRAFLYLREYDRAIEQYIIWYDLYYGENE